MGTNYYLYQRYQTGYGIITNQVAHIGLSGRSMDIISLAKVFEEYLECIFRCVSQQNEMKHEQLIEVAELLHRWICFNDVFHSETDRFTALVGDRVTTDVVASCTDNADNEETPYRLHNYKDGTFHNLLMRTLEWLTSKDEFFVQDEYGNDHDLMKIFEYHRNSTTDHDIELWIVDGYRLSQTTDFF